MKKCQGLLNHLLYFKIKHNNPNRSLDSSTSNNTTKIIKDKTKVNKLLQKGSLNKTDNPKLHNSVIEEKTNNQQQNYINHSKIISQNHSFTTTLSSENVILRLSNNKSSTYQNQQTKPNLHQNQETKVNPNAFRQSMNTKSNSTYYNKMKQKMISSTVIQDKQPANVSFYQLHKNLLSNMKKKKKSGKTNKGRHYLNKSMSNYEEEWCNNNESYSNTMQSSSLINKIKAVERKLIDGLSNLQYNNEGKIVSSSKSYNLYRVALEEISKELPKDCYTLIKKIINGYHEIILSFISEQKKIIENYDELKISILYI